MSKWIYILGFIALIVISYYIYKSVQAKNLEVAQTAQLNTILAANQANVNEASNTTYGPLGEITSGLSNVLSGTSGSNIIKGVLAIL